MESSPLGDAQAVGLLVDAGLARGGGRPDGASHDAMARDVDPCGRSGGAVWSSELPRETALVNGGPAYPSGQRRGCQDFASAASSSSSEFLPSPVFGEMRSGGVAAIMARSLCM